MLAEQNIYPKIVHFTRLGAKSCCGLSTNNPLELLDSYICY